MSKLYNAKANRYLDLIKEDVGDDIIHLMRLGLNRQQIEIEYHFMIRQHMKKLKDMDEVELEELINGED
ncbi:hypothetical protein AB3N02_22815 [Priestia aryabhattai]|uniref:hypothetical protein n=1 Tax=Priestia aryabhattai TaxID=412384 RepID=UPI0039A27D83